MNSDHVSRDDSSEPRSSQSSAAPEPAPEYSKTADLYEAYKRAAESGDTKTAGNIQWEIAIANEKLIWWWASQLWYKWKPPSLTIQDLAHYGMFGVLRAVEKFKPAFNTKLSTYASWWIRRYIESAIFENGTTIRIPEYRINQKAQVDLITLELLEQGVEPSPQNIAAALNSKKTDSSSDAGSGKKPAWTPEIIQDINNSTHQVFSSIDKTVFDDGMEELHNFIPDGNSAISPETAVMSPFLREGFHRILASAGLSGKTWLVLELYFYGESRNKAEIERIFQTSKEEFTGILNDFMTRFPHIFSIANTQREQFLHIIEFSRMSEKKRALLEQHFQGRGARHSDENTAGQTKAILQQIAQKHPNLHGIAQSDPAVFFNILQFCRIPDEHKVMLGLYFCGDEMSKNDVGILCRVTRERVRQIVDDFTTRYRGPLSRLFLRDFISPQEICEQFVNDYYHRYKHELASFLAKHRQADTLELVKNIYIKRITHKELIEHMHISSSTLSGRLKTLSKKLRAAPGTVTPLICGGAVGLRPREILVRQIWDMLPRTSHNNFISLLSEDEMIIFYSRLALNTTQITLKELSKKLGRKNASEISSIFNTIVHEFFEFAAQVIQQQHNHKRVPTE